METVWATTLLMRQAALSQVKQTGKIWQKWNFNSKYPSLTYVLITWCKLSRFKTSSMLVIDTQTRSLSDMASERKANRFPTSKFPQNSCPAMGERRSFLFVIGKVITLKAPSVCAPVLTNKQHQNYHFDILICSVLACESYLCHSEFSFSRSLFEYRELSSKF